MDALQVVCFVVGPHQCALDILAVREIIHPSPITPMPGATGGCEGLIELRGAYLPVVDLRKRLALDASVVAERYVVAQLPGPPPARIALIVDRVLDVRRIPRAELLPPPALAASAPPCVRAVARQGDDTVLLLDLAQLIGADALR
jgi:purine-binding chemotaxis protein CheW